VCYNSFANPNYDPEGNTPIPTILPIQGTFDKAIPDNFGNAEYRAERKLVIAIDVLFIALAVRDDLIDRARLATARGLCKKLVHFGAPAISGAEGLDKQCRKSLYCHDLE